MKVCGAAPELGTWNAEEAVPLTWATGDIWSATVDINDDHTSSQWKLIIAREDGETEWENCDNRILTLGEEVNVLFAGRGEPTPEAEVASEEQAATGAESEVRASLNKCFNRSVGAALSSEHISRLRTAMPATPLLPQVEEASTVSSNGHAEAAVPTASSKDSASEEADEHLSSPPPPSKSAASPAAGKVPDLEEVVKSGSKAPAEAGGSAAAGWPWK